MPTPHHMKDWELEAALAALDPFAPETANCELEQYSTSAHLAAQILRHFLAVRREQRQVASRVGGDFRRRGRARPCP